MHGPHSAPATFSVNNTFINFESDDADDYDGDMQRKGRRTRTAPAQLLTLPSALFLNDDDGGAESSEECNYEPFAATPVTDRFAASALVVSFCLPPGSSGQWPPAVATPVFSGHLATSTFVVSVAQVGGGLVLQIPSHAVLEVCVTESQVGSASPPGAVRVEVLLGSPQGLRAVASDEPPVGKALSKRVVRRIRARMAAKATPPVEAGRADAGKTASVCCHWKNKGFCRYLDSCKFQHPVYKQGMGLPRAEPTGLLAPRARHERVLSSMGKPHSESMRISKA